ncbi:hypothetical protein [Lentzea cavernae]|uniref:VWFA domain-containing protein n=1 Tax=Lentzea cavernae TaxID=2020703 RepID=A0ABQ3MLZ9_9PSEU|nr:hypothetical protein [Lentzea cavernae]GHH50326.1 hypothetical protein GCM10017774_58990 [Lentzea cavernae]
MKRWWLVAGAVVLVLGLTTGGLWVFLTPAHRTTFLVDASESSADFREVAEAVGAAASNMSPDDSLALRKFGGSCDSPSTSEVVTPGTGQATQIVDAARAIAPSGKATLLNGVLAAIDDFARAYPFRGSETNHVVVIARGDADSCGKSADEVRAIVADHTARSGVKIDFRYVGHQLSPEQAKVLTEIADASNAQQPRLTKTSAELVTAVKEVSVPTDLVTQQVKTNACDGMSPETLSAARPLDADLLYFDIRCKDRYAIAAVNTALMAGDSGNALFEFKEGRWQYLSSGVPPACDPVPQEVWQDWKLTCKFEPVVCSETPSKVTDVDGVGCPAAIDIANRYRAAITAGEPQGQGLFWDSAEWSCVWPYEDGYSHAGTPLKCTRTTDNKVIRIGEYQR